MPRLRMFCNRCGSTNVCRDAHATWNEETQEWELAGLHDSGFCSDCGRDGPVEEEEIDDESQSWAANKGDMQ